MDTGATLIPIEIKATAKVTMSSLRRLMSFLDTYKWKVKQAYVITIGRMLEKLTDKVLAVLRRYL